MYMKDDTEEDVDDDACNKQQGHSGYHDDDKGDNQCTVIEHTILQCKNVLQCKRSNRIKISDSTTRLGCLSA